MSPRISIDDLADQITGRRRSLFAEDCELQRAAMVRAVAGRRVLVIGGAGTIGTATLRQLLPLRPRRLVVVDHNENGLAELVRDLRSSDGLHGVDLHTLPVDFGGPAMRHFLAEEAPFHLVMNFAACKHVRSEKDRSSLLQMLDTNLVKAHRLMQWLVAGGGCGRYFSVSTDKAANPVNLMGASKRLMELCMFRDGAMPTAEVTSARFANVAFSDGSLLCSFLQRLAKGQPLAVPKATKRFFVSPAESGQLCALAATIGRAQHVLVPRLDAQRDLVLLEDVAATVVAAHGFAPRFYDEEAAAKAAYVQDVAKGQYPILRTALDTTGEKAFEEFVGRDEQVIEVGLQQLQGIRQAAGPAASAMGFMTALLDELNEPRARRSMAALTAAMQAVLPEFAHRKSDQHLDQRM